MLVREAVRIPGWRFASCRRRECRTGSKAPLNTMRPRLHLLWIVTVIGLGMPACSRSDPMEVPPPRADGPDFIRDNRDLSRPLRMIVYGDMRFTDPKVTSATNPKVRRWLVEKIAAERPDAVLLSGDVPWHGGEASDYDVYRAETKMWRDAHLFIYPALGNHELLGTEGECLENWWKAFPELRGRRWYSVRLGDALYILNLDSNSSLLPGSEQIEWIRSQLSHLPAGTRFVFFNMHHPPVVDVQPHGDASHNGRPNEHAQAEFLARAAEKSRARFVVEAGHIHNYERFDQDGIVYVVSGGGGARPRPIIRGPADLYRDGGFPNYHYMRFIEDGSRLIATMVRVADPDGATPRWEEKDRFEIQAAIQSKAASAKPRQRGSPGAEARTCHSDWRGRASLLMTSQVPVRLPKGLGTPSDRFR